MSLPSRRIPVIVVSGFLGSGKTTFLRYLIKNSNKKFGLLINEFGDVGIDGDLLKNHLSCENGSDECVIELNNGCICCTVQDDFIPSLKTLLNQTLNIEVIIIETSGLALPLPLLKALNWPEIRMSVYLDLVVGIVNGESMLEGSPINSLDKISSQFEDTQIIEHKTSINELFEEQLEVSDLVLISRSDLINDEEYINIKNEVLKKTNPNVPVIKCFNGEINLNYIFDSNLQKQNSNNFIKDENNHDHSHVEIYSSSLKSNYFLDKNEFEIEMKELLKDLKFLRIKGRVWIPNKTLPLQVQIVGSKINTWFEEAPLDSWRPKLGGGLELIMIGFEEMSFKLLETKITEKFNVLNVPN
tara:strand:+ start:19486 stop:20556 length:1071 start_codon:yes stop_codon:yes gene_type:complete